MWSLNVKDIIFKVVNMLDAKIAVLAMSHDFDFYQS